MTITGNDAFRASFFEECEELLETMQDGFDQLAEDAGNIETMNAIFRAVHSIKGGAGAFRLDVLVGFAHHFETGLDKLRAGHLDVTPDLLGLIRRCGDHLSDLVDLARNDATASLDTTEPLTTALSEAFGIGEQPEDEAMPAFEPVALDFGSDAEHATNDASDDAGIEFTFKAKEELFGTGNEPLALFRALSRLGPVTAEACLKDVPSLCDLDPATCHIRWTIRLHATAPEEEVLGVFDFVEGMCSIDMRNRRETLAPVAPTPDLPLPDLPQLDDIPGAPEVKTATTPRANAGQTTVGPAPAPMDRKEDRKPAGTIRVDLEKVDKLINLVGELVIKEAMLSQSIEGFNLSPESEISVGLDSLKQLAGEIQEGVMAVRAQPVKPMFQRMSRTVRETSSATGKPVRFTTDGEYTEVDRTVIERLLDPLTHMIRNAIDHGLEDPDTRAKSGKPPEGRITLSAAHRSGRVVIDVSDDGGGINRQKVRQIAVEKGLIAESAELTPVEIDNLLFLPGFSCKDEVSELSGRGVGLDVVRSEINGLGGRVLIHSQPGEGTTFSISLPLTLAVQDGMVIRVAGQTMVVPISAIEETLRPKTAEIDVIGPGTRVLRNRDGLVPIVDLGSFFGFRDEPANLSQHVLLLIDTGNSLRFALVVDDIQDQRQVVIKSLETNYGQVGGVAAATILGDGRIALIIDPERVFSQFGQGPSIEFPEQRAG